MSMYVCLDCGAILKSDQVTLVGDNWTHQCEITTKSIGQDGHEHESRRIGRVIWTDGMFVGGRLKFDPNYPEEPEIESIDTKR